MWPWGKRTVPQPSDEARRAVDDGQRQLADARLRNVEASEIRTAALRAVEQNHFGLAVTAAMGGKGRT